MAISQTRYYELKELPLGALARAIRGILDHFSIDATDIKFTANYGHGGTQEERSLTIEDIGAICAFSGNPDGLRFGFNDESQRWHFFSISEYHGLYFVHASAASAEATAKIFDIAQGILCLKQVPSPPTDEDERIDLIEQRLDEIEQRFTVTNDQLTCFLSYRFSDRSKLYALELTRFLELAGVNVVSGVGYEPRRVTDKVRARLNQPLDFLVYLMTPDGESMWTRDELAVALAKGHAVVLLVEAGAKVEQGLLGNWEYLEFQRDHISDSFVGILEALRFIRRERRSQTSREAEPTEQLNRE